MVIFLTIEVYKSWIVGRVEPMIFSAVLTVHWSLFLSYLRTKSDSKSCAQDRLNDSRVDVEEQILTSSTAVGGSSASCI